MKTLTKKKKSYVNPIVEEENSRIAELFPYIGKEVSDNFSPSLRSLISAYVGNGKFSLIYVDKYGYVNPNNEGRVVKWWELDMMIFGV